MGAVSKPTPSSSRWISFKALSFLYMFASQSFAQNGTCTVPLLFEPTRLQNREPTDPSFADNAQFQKQVVDDHNFYRSQHGASPLKWNDQLALSSNDWVNKCQWGHSGHQGVGENIALGYSKALDAINAWALERVNYNFNKPGFGSQTGHFTQVVWKTTTDVGCARKQCQVPGFSNGNPTWYLVCQYQSPGNVVNAGQFEENVGRQISGDPKVGIPGTLSSTPPKSSGSPTRTAAPVPTSQAKTEIAITTVTVTVTEDAASPFKVSSPAETGKTPADSRPTTGPFWGNLKTGIYENSFLNIIRRRGGSGRVEEDVILAMISILVAITFALM
ncbi:uncharacterized protein RCO7_14005 [Rhynchosporium graminicola]|uniref:SCP domain-containing protein n=1 Tax=Rhynchosporium graminicola TaxID=2792576 RepID=A0A1E1JQG5_9HELO|nr:uncharacterized protein RCO7_14005 [Rhynchosporium commune]